tara:strand:+ start:1983 stop:3254 length:1272 start_codon:yes stop_codon:yes gene_type:complete
MTDNEIDINPDNYTLSDYTELFKGLAKILNIDYANDSTSISNIANVIISKNKKGSDLNNFFTQARDKLLESIELENKLITNKSTSIKNIYISSKFRKNNVFDGDYSNITTPFTSIYSETSFLFNLTTPIKNVTNIKINSVEIPFTWYNIDSNSNTNYFFINHEKVELISGRYNIDTIINSINENEIFSKYAFISINTVNYKPKIQSIDNNNELFILFHDSDAARCEARNYINRNLGWLLGFRNMSYNFNTNIISECVINLNIHQYFFITLEEYNNSKDNSELITISNKESNLKIPEYFNDVNLPITSIENRIAERGRGIASRLITIPQQYTINEIQNSIVQPNNRATLPALKDILAIIPIDINGLTFCQDIISYDNSDKLSRSYFGKINIQNMYIKLIDNFGDVVNLNGTDWSLNIECVHENN